MARAILRVLLPYLAAIGAGCCAVAVDLHNDEVQAAVLVLLVGGLLIGMGWPARAWRRAAILGLSIIVGDYAGPRLGLAAVAPAPLNWGALVALIPAFIGSYVGVAVRTGLSGPGGPGKL